MGYNEQVIVKMDAARATAAAQPGPLEFVKRDAMKIAIT
jgi:hypothetical protein